MFKNKKWICNFIALFILLTGMCFDEVKADSFFPCPEVAVLTSERTADAVLTDVDVEPTELLCTRNSITGSQIAAQITSGRRTIKLAMIFLCVAVFSLLLSNFYMTERVTELPRLCARTVVVNYIHNTDGKK